MKKVLILVPFLLFGGALLVRPAAAMAAAQEGMRLCFRSVIPSLFPMMAVTGLLLRLGAAERLQGLFAPFMGPLFRLRGVCAAPLLMGLVGGYPLGAAAAADLYRQNRCTREEAERLLSFCNNCGPAFLLSYVGAGLFGSSLTGCRLYLIHTASALAVGLALCRLGGGKREALPAAGTRRGRPLSLPEAFTQAVTASLQSMLNICAFVTLFSVAAALLPAGTPPLATGLLEMTGGLSRLGNTRAGRAAAGMLTGFGGLSVHCQTLSVLADTDLDVRRYFAGKTLQALLSGALAWLLL